MNLLPKDPSGCPFLILAPMEGVGDCFFRKAIAGIGGFDEAVRDFLRVPKNAHVKSLASVYESDEIAPYRLAAQLMGSDPTLMAEMASEIERRGAPRIDLNCGCPSNTVTGRGAGSSLLKEPDFLYEVASRVRGAISIPFTIKMRSGYSDTSLFKENLLAAQASGACYITLHPRTKVDGYTPPARWDLIQEAKSLLTIPVVGNGDILDVKGALKMLQETACDALMIGRASLINPFIFHEIKAHFSKTPFQPTQGQLKTYFHTFLSEMKKAGVPERIQVNKLKQLMGFFFKSKPELIERRNQILTLQEKCPDSYLTTTFSIIENL